MLVEQKWTRIKNPAPPHSHPSCLPLQMFADGTKTRRKLYLDGAERKTGETRASQRQLEEMGANGPQLKRGKLDKIRLTIEAAACFFLVVYWLLLAIYWPFKLKYERTRKKLFNFVC